MHLCPNEIKSNAFLMPQQHFPSMRWCACKCMNFTVIKLPHPCKNLQKSPSNPVAGKVIYSLDRDQGENSWTRICKAAHNCTADVGY